MIDEAGLELTSAIAVSSPTIDCVPDNDASATGVIVVSTRTCGSPSAARPARPSAPRRRTS